MSVSRPLFARLPNEPLVSCLCVTEDRAAFMPWLLWCFDRQVWPVRELVIVDSSEQPVDVSGRDDVRVVRLPAGAGIACKRNAALHASRGDLVAWFDDDDWQHPQKLAVHVEALRDGKAYAGSRPGWFVDLQQSRCALFHGAKAAVTFNSAAFRRDAVLPVRFREDLPRASDTWWMRVVAARYPRHATIVDRDDLFFWLSHSNNVSNPAGKKRFTHRLDFLRDRIGPAAWGDTDAALDALRTRLEESRRASTATSAGGSRVSVCSEKTAGDGKPITVEPPAVGLMIKATVLDAPFLDVMVRHMIGQARYDFAERAIVVDRPRAFTGKYGARPASSEQELASVLDALLRDGIVDRVREVDYAPEAVERVTAQYFVPSAQSIPTHASTGGPVYATLFGLESMSTDHVLQMDADILFHTGPTSWIHRALQCMAADPRLWLMMTHPGPPAGPVGRSLGRENRSRSIWDADLGVWRFRHATTRYFLCDRRTLRHRLPLIADARGCAPLEQCISKALQQNGAFRGNLGDLRSWHLHVWHHGDPFPTWAPALVRTIEAGSYPAFQRGQYDLRFDRASDRSRWEELLRDKAERQADSRRTASSGNGIARLTTAGVNTSPVSVIIPVRDRAGQRLRNTLRSLQWQSAGPPAQVIVVSHGSTPAIDAELQTLCRDEAATLITVSHPDEPWNKSLALNIGIRRSTSDLPFLMTMDADMVLAPDFLSVVVQRLQNDPPALVLCRISDLPPQAVAPVDRDPWLASFDRLRALTRLRSPSGSGGIQAASRSFFFAIRGYDEDLAWWGAMDGDLVGRARLMNLDIEWIEDRTAMLHQWHARKHAALIRPEQILEAKRAWRHNHVLVRSRRKLLLRNPKAWGGVDDRIRPNSRKTALR